ncbi:Dynactin subunit 6 [Aphelenchoides fujianensis]|nr:Dynactin subunit 6 [Aphelenchoides fujianensis]
MDTTSENKRVQIHAETFVHTASVLSGQLTFGEGCVIHPLARIDAGDGEIVFGKNNIVEERAVIVNRLPGHRLVIGDENHFEVGATCFATAVGNRNVFGMQSTVGEHVQVADGCVIGAKCEVREHGELPAQTCVYGLENNRRKMGSMPPTLELHSKFLAVEAAEVRVRLQKPRLISRPFPSCFILLDQ